MADSKRKSVHMPSLNASSNSDHDNSSEVDRREFIQQTAVGGAILATWTDTQVAAAGQRSFDESPEPEAIATSFRVNGREHELQLVPQVTLLDALRERLGLTGTKKGCDHGQCGACTVLVNGKRINSCLTLAVMNDGAEITTIEGLANGETLHPLQQAFIEHDGFQCGYCTAGQICSAAGLIAEGRAKTPEDIRELMSGNLCRCGAYPNILAAIRQVLQAAEEGDSP
jgi:xanthine dehydrogenase YagT iron-sulfur-binding subunit